MTRVTGEEDFFRGLPLAFKRTTKEKTPALRTGALSFGGSRSVENERVIVEMLGRQLLRAPHGGEGVNPNRGGGVK